MQAAILGFALVIAACVLCALLEPAGSTGRRAYILVGVVLVPALIVVMLLH